MNLVPPSRPLPPLAAVNREPTERVFRALALAVNFLLRLTARDWRHQERLPPVGGVLIVANHISKFDPLALGHFLIWSGRWPRFMGKVQLFRSPLIGWLARGCGQIPVERGTDRAADALLAARGAIAAGKAVCIYPEGTITADPDGWPMTPRTGAARLALGLRCPVIPVGQWGAHEIMPGKGRSIPWFFPRRTLRFALGEPVDLTDLYDLEATPEVVAEAGRRIIEAITALVAEVRGAVAPSEHWDIRAGRRLPLPRLGT